ncbi:MAG: hypothetical protein EP329_13260 [Deltaproteobacteria bacterium]|nr:MAG: hypothetical protein EP329_13260 [Deltaproteobacteria bacterium]
MGFFEFMTVAVVFGSIFGWLTFRNAFAGRRRIAALERRLAALEQRDAVGDLPDRVAVLEEIVVGDDAALQRKIHAAALTAPVAGHPARATARREEVEEA